jgi:hypothetical protein
MHRGHAFTNSAAWQYAHDALDSGTFAPHRGHANIAACSFGASIVNTVPHRHRARLPTGLPARSYRASHAGQATITIRG